MMLELALVTGRPFDELLALSDEGLATVVELVEERAARRG